MVYPLAIGRKSDSGGRANFFSTRSLLVSHDAFHLWVCAESGIPRLSGRRSGGKRPALLYSSSGIMGTWSPALHCRAHVLWDPGDT